MDATTICACATALPAAAALVRLSGPEARAIAQAAGLDLPQAWQWTSCQWDLLATEDGQPAGACPSRVGFFPQGRSYTGYDLIEIVLPGNSFIVDFALQRLLVAGAEMAGPGAFSRQALATGRLTLDEAEAVLDLVTAADVTAAQQALQRLHGALGAEFEPLRQEVLHLRALVEAGLDFIEEPDVEAYDHAAARSLLEQIRATIARWRRAATSLGLMPEVLLVGAANAGKSALFRELTGAAALVSSTPGTTRDWLDAAWELPGGRTVRLVDTAGWLQAAASLDQAAIDMGQQRLAAASLIICCSAPDAPLPPVLDGVLPNEVEHQIIATKADLAVQEPRAVLAVSSEAHQGLEALAGLVEHHLAAQTGADPRQQALLADADGVLESLLQSWPPDEILATQLRVVADTLATC